MPAGEKSVFLPAEPLSPPTQDLARVSAIRSASGVLVLLRETQQADSRFRLTQGLMQATCQSTLPNAVLHVSRVRHVS